MLNNVKDFVEIFKCPYCEEDLVVDGENLKCGKCDGIIPVVNGVAIFLSQKEWKEFFSKSHNFENYTMDSEKLFLKEILEQDDYLKSIQMIDKYTDSEENKKTFAEITGSTEIDDKELERAILEANDKILDKGEIDKAKMILDWPTGPGAFIRKMVNKISSDAVIVSSEINLLSIFRLKKYLESKGLAGNILFVNNDVIKMPFKDDIFDLVSVFGLTVEVPDSDKALSETYRVMKSGGAIVGSGEIYKEGSKSMKLADEMNIGQLCTSERFSQKINKIGFKNIDIEIAYEGYDADDLPDEERCPLPVRGDWFSYVIIKAEK